MPIYEYRCQSCHAKFEKLIASAAGPPAAGITCPCCGSSQVQFEFSAFAIVGSESKESTSASAGCPCTSGVCELGRDAES